MRDRVVGVGGDDPAARDLLDRQRVARAAHLDRVLEPGLLVGRERERRPEARVLQRPLGVGVVGELDLDHAVDRVRLALGLLEPLGDGRQQLLLVQLHALAAGADEAVAGAAGVARDLRAARRDVDRDRRVGAVVDGGLDGLVVVALEADALALPQRAHQPHRLAQPAEALLELRPLDAGDGDLVHRLAGPDPEHHAAREQAAHRRERLGDHGGLVAEGGGEHAGAEQDALGALADRAHPRERERRVAALVAPRLVVVGHDDAVEAALLGGHAELDELARAELLGGGLVADAKGHDRESRVRRRMDVPDGFSEFEPQGPFLQHIGPIQVREDGDGRCSGCAPRSATPTTAARSRAACSRPSPTSCSAARSAPTPTTTRRARPSR